VSDRTGGYDKALSAAPAGSSAVLPPIRDRRSDELDVVCVCPGRYILFLSRLSEAKGVDDLITGYLRSRAYLEGRVPLLICGTGPAVEGLRNQAAGEPLIRFFSKVSDEEKRVRGVWGKEGLTGTYTFFVFRLFLSRCACTAFSSSGDVLPWPRRVLTLFAPRDVFGRCCSTGAGPTSCRPSPRPPSSRPSASPSPRRCSAGGWGPSSPHAPGEL
jgi:glycosyltransferase involved in cell wall biosynthesis